jgi:uncharacterized membrane protein
MSKVEDFLTQAQEQEIIDAIRVAEKNTSGEIRVHLEKNSVKDPLERAKEVFYFLKMDKTKNKNGVLFYVAVDDKKFSVLGDEGIDKVVPNDFWNSIKDAVIQRFSTGNYSDGLKEGILATGQKLKEFFPYKSNDDDELSNEISLG